MLTLGAYLRFPKMAPGPNMNIKSKKDKRELDASYRSYHGAVIVRSRAVIV